MSNQYRESVMKYRAEHLAEYREYQARYHRLWRLKKKNRAKEIVWNVNWRKRNKKYLREYNKHYNENVRKAKV